MSNPRIARGEALLAAMCAGTIVFALVFVFPLVVPQPVLSYYPIARHWAFEVKPAGLAMDFFGRLLFGVVAWSVTVMATLLIAHRFSRLDARVRTLLLAWAVAAVVLVMCYFAWMLLHRVPVPVPLPEGYTPR